MVILGLHRDNGSEDINARVAALLAKLHAEFTQSRSRRTNDNALAESKNGSVIRKHLGYSHIPGRFAQQVNDFAPGVLSPYLNCHRPCCFPTEAIDAKGRLRKRYPYATMTTPYEKLKSLPEATQYLKPGVTFEDLDAIAYAISDHEAARRLNEARATRCRSNQPSLTTRGLIRALTPLQAHFWIGKDFGSLVLLAQSSNVPFVQFSNVPFWPTGGHDARGDHRVDAASATSAEGRRGGHGPAADTGGSRVAVVVKFFRTPR